MVLVRPRTWPDTTDTAPNSPMARALHRMAPYSRPHLMFGSVTRQNICQPLAPSVSAACSSSLPCACISGISSRATNGKVTNRLARMMPGTAYTILMSCACNQPPNQPCVPNSSTKTSPATTGDTENGRSISVIRNCLPRNWNLVMAQAAATPNTRFTGSAMAATSKVRRIAAQASGSTMASRYKAQPLRKASANTAASGTSRNSVRNSSAMPNRMPRIQRGSVRWAGRWSTLIRLSRGRGGPASPAAD